MMEPHQQHASGMTGADLPFRHLNRAHSWPDGRGLLPLKKRRLLDAMQSASSLLGINTQYRSPSPTNNMCGNAVNIIAPSPHLRGLGGGSDEKIAALALVAAASGASSVTGLPATVVSSSTDSYTNTSDAALSSTAHQPLSVASSRSLLIHDDGSQRNLSEGRTGCNGQTLRDDFYSSQPQLQEQHQQQQQQQQQQQPRTESEQLSEQQQQPAVKPATNGTSRQRVHHPPLTSPLPGGCHGRTSRNNSYCRRIPCYNGSKYCKLHYQQFVVNAGGSANIAHDLCGQESAAATPGKVAPKKAQTAMQLTDASAPKTHMHAHNPHHQQDKRYTGDISDESPCRATTTRGRPCAYVAVGGTKYCHLHADYDTNPPPRRGGCSGVSASSVKSLGNTSSTTSDSGRSGDVTTSPVTGQLHVPIAKEPCAADEHRHPARGSSSESSLRTDVQNGIKGKCSHYSYPLLNSIPSDQWSNKLVLISTGPLVNHTGRVAKWGNGWITVRTTTSGESDGDSVTEDGGLLHNRRAIELYVLPDPEDRGGERGFSANGEGKEERGEDGTGTMNSKKAQLKISPAAVDKERHDEIVLATVPNGPSCINQVESNASSQRRGDIEDALRMSSPSADKGAEEEAPEAKKVDSSDVTKDVKNPTADSVSGRPGKASSLTFPSSKKSPTKRHIDSDVPLAEALSRAQEGGRMHTIDVLFGTAALERSRRTIHKPERYEDTAMIERKKSDGGDLVASPSKKNSGGGVCGGALGSSSPNKK